MGSFTKGSVVLVRFPFSDLSTAKLRPAVVLADCGREDWLLCQITSNRYADPLAIEIKQSDFSSGALKVTSFARPGKLFTGSNNLIAYEIGLLHPATINKIIEHIVNLLRSRV